MSNFAVNGDMFGMYAKIPTGFSKEMHIYKIVSVFESNAYCEVPLLTIDTKETTHDKLVIVLNVIHCGVDESEVIRVALKDCEVFKKEPQECNSDLISRKKLIDDLDKLHRWYFTDGKGTLVNILKVKETINNQQQVQLIQENEVYIKLSDLQKYPIRINHYDKQHGNEHFINGIESVIEYAENLPQVYLTVRDTKKEV